MPDHDGDHRTMARALLGNLPELRSRLHKADLPEFDLLYADLRAATDPETVRVILERIEELVHASLPPDDPALTGHRFGEDAGVHADPALLAALALVYGGDALAERPDQGSSGGEPATGGAGFDWEAAATELAAELLAAPAYTAEDLRRRSHDPLLPHLIRLRRADGTVQLPAFQFGPDGSPRELVLAVNRLIGADRDPWGAADWWLGPHGWLPAPPAECLDTEPDELILRAARIVGEVV